MTVNKDEVVDIVLELFRSNGIAFMTILGQKSVYVNDSNPKVRRLFEKLYLATHDGEKLLSRD